MTLYLVEYESGGEIHSGLETADAEAAQAAANALLSEGLPARVIVFDLDPEDVERGACGA